jgi:hypothetical protein
MKKAETSKEHAVALATADNESPSRLLLNNEELDKSEIIE